MTRAHLVQLNQTFSPALSSFSDDRCVNGVEAMDVNRGGEGQGQEQRDGERPNRFFFQSRLPSDSERSVSTSAGLET
jgi:hypothetical protein